MSQSNLKSKGNYIKPNVKFPAPGEKLTGLIEGPLATFLTPEQKEQNREFAKVARQAKKDLAREQNRKESEAYKAEREARASLYAKEEIERAKAREAAEKRRKYEDRFTSIVHNLINSLPKLDGIEKFFVDYKSETSFRINFTCWQEPNVSFDYLQSVSDLLKTRKINLVSGGSFGGCESCGHGEQWSFSLVCSDCILPA